jgi:hypothetical protein
VKRPCLDCGRLTSGSRCPTHEAQRNASRRGREKYDAAWVKLSKRAIAEHLATYGPVCPGWGREAHVVDPKSFVTDHDPAPHGTVMCRGCNSRKAALHDRPRAQAARGE